MPRSTQQKAELARRYGRRMRVLKAAGSAKDFARVARELLAQLEKAGATSSRAG